MHLQTKPKVLYCTLWTNMFYSVATGLIIFSTQVDKISPCILALITVPLMAMFMSGYRIKLWPSKICFHSGRSAQDVSSESIAIIRFLLLDRVLFYSSGLAPFPVWMTRRSANQLLAAARRLSIQAEAYSPKEGRMLGPSNRVFWYAVILLFFAWWLVRAALGESAHFLAELMAFCLVAGIIATYALFWNRGVVVYPEFIELPTRVIENDQVLSVNTEKASWFQTAIALHLRDGTIERFKVEPLGARLLKERYAHQTLLTKVSVAAVEVGPMRERDLE
jgi:hypothetical protein